MDVHLKVNHISLVITVNDETYSAEVSFIEILHTYQIKYLFYYGATMLRLMVCGCFFSINVLAHSVEFQFIGFIQQLYFMQKTVFMSAYNCSHVLSHNNMFNPV